MGFFFSTQARSKQKAQANRQTSFRQKQDSKILNRLGCAACPLNKVQISTPKMEPSLVEKAKVYFLAEAPGKDEDENSGKPLTGPSGQLLKECIPKPFVNYCAFDNVINCRPQNNRPPTPVEIECCRPRRGKYVGQAKPKLVVGLGLVPLQAILHSTDMAGMRGRLFAVKIGNHACWFMPTYHPSFILRIAYNKKKPLNSKMGHCFRTDIKRACDLADTLTTPVIDTEIEARAGIQCFDGHGDSTALWGLLAEVRKAPHKAIDIETSHLRPYAADARMLTAALSFGTKNIAFAIDHPKAGWSPDSKAKILAELKSIVSDETIKIAHNAPFELEWFIKYFGKEVVRHDVWECTQMQAHFLDERKGRQAHGSDEESRRATYQSLDFLCKQHFGAAYKSYFKLNKKDMAKADLGETLIYNGADTKYTLRLWQRQKALLAAGGLTDAYYEALPRQPTVALMQAIGLGIDQAEVAKAQERLGAEITAIEAQVNDLKVVKAFKADRKEFNPLSNQDALLIFKDYLKRPEIQPVIERDREGNESTKYSIDKNVLDTIDHPLAQLIVSLRNRRKLKSTYVDCFELGKGAFIWPDGLVHTHFNTTFTETSRLSSDEPNQQNWPKRNDLWVRKQVKPGKGQLILAFDYGQLEACTAAICSKDKVLVKALWEDYDIHKEWTHKLAAKWPALCGGYDQLKEPKNLKKYRSLVKNRLVFPAIFGAQTDSIAGYLGAPEDVIEDLMDEFWETFCDLKKWQDALMKQYWETGVVANLTGRQHRYPLTKNQVVNFPIQSLAADIVCDGMCRLSYNARQSGQWYLHPVLNIHDDLSMIVPDDDKTVEETIEHTCKIMLTPPYDFINVPLSVECSVGEDWFKMQDIGRFSSKDI